jgi:hypothetical protein
MIRMPGRTFEGPPPPFLPAEQELAAQLKRDIEVLAGRIGPRNYVAYAQLLDAASYIEGRFREAGYSDVLNFIAFVGNFDSRDVVRRAIRTFRKGRHFLL